jgi:FkbM family methyltransferase
MLRWAVKSVVHWLGYRLVREVDRVGLRDKRKSLSLIAKSGFTPDIVIDIGVATGTDGLCDVWPSVETILVEPLAKFEPDLIRICRSLPNASYRIAAAGGGAGALRLASHPDEPYTIRPAADAPEAWPRFEVAQVTVNSLIAGKAIRRAVLKIDVDGPELSVLRGANAVLAVDAVVVIEAALLDTAIGRLGQIIQFMAEAGYECFDIIEPMFRAADDLLWQVDLVFVRRESELRALRSFR